MEEVTKYEVDGFEYDSAEQAAKAEARIAFNAIINRIGNIKEAMQTGRCLTPTEAAEELPDIIEALEEYAAEYGDENPNRPEISDCGIVWNNHLARLFSGEWVKDGLIR